MTIINQLQKRLAELETGEDHVQRQALHSLRALEPAVWNAVPPAHVLSFLSAFRRQLLRENKLAVVHKDIAAILGSMGPLSQAAVLPLNDLLQDGIPDCVREAAAAALGKLGSAAKSAAPRLVELASSPAAIARHAVCALGDIGCADQRVRNTLANLWRTPAHSHAAAVQLAVAMCKLQIHVDGVDVFLINTLFDNQGEAVRMAAAEGLSWCGKNDSDIVPALLLAHASDKSELVRGAALTACTRLCLSHQNAIRACAKQLKESTRAEAALRKTGAPAIPALIDALSASDTSVRLKATRILSGFGELASAAVKKLTMALHDGNPEIRLASAKCLWNVTKNADVVVPALVQLLNDSHTERLDDESRRMYLQTIIEALSRIGPNATAAVPAIAIKVKDKNRLVSQTARQALNEIQLANGKK
jgi:HEAT repeat protein